MQERRPITKGALTTAPTHEGLLTVVNAPNTSPTGPTREDLLTSRVTVVASHSRGGRVHVLTISGRNVPIQEGLLMNRGHPRVRTISSPNVPTHEGLLMNRGRSHQGPARVRIMSSPNALIHEGILLNRGKLVSASPNAPTQHPAPSRETVARQDTGIKLPS